MPTIEIDIANKIAKPRGSQQIILGNNDYSIKFYFDSQWSAYTYKTIELSMLSVKTGMLQKKEILFSGDTVDLPEILNTRQISVNVYAGDIRTSSSAIISCTGDIDPTNNPHPNPEPDVYAQLLNLLRSLQGGSPVCMPVRHPGGAVGGIAGIPEIVEEES